MEGVTITRTDIEPTISDRLSSIPQGGPAAGSYFYVLAGDQTNDARSGAAYVTATSDADWISQVRGFYVPSHSASDRVASERATIRIDSACVESTQHCLWIGHRSSHAVSSPAFFAERSLVSTLLVLVWRSDNTELHRNLDYICHRSEGR